MNTFELKTGNGVVTYSVDDLDFINIMCDLEGRDIDVVGMMSSDDRGGKIFTFIRAIVAMLLKEDETSAGKKLSEHMRNGGSIDDVMDSFAGLMNKAGFGEAEQTTETEVPQDTESNTDPSQN